MVTSFVPAFVLGMCVEGEGVGDMDTEHQKSDMHFLLHAATLCGCFSLSKHLIYFGFYILL